MQRCKCGYVLTARKSPFAFVLCTVRQLRLLSALILTTSKAATGSFRKRTGSIFFNRHPRAEFQRLAAGCTSAVATSPAACPLQAVRCAVAASYKRCFQRPRPFFIRAYDRKPARSVKNKTAKSTPSLTLKTRITSPVGRLTEVSGVADIAFHPLFQSKPRSARKKIRDFIMFFKHS